MCSIAKNDQLIKYIYEYKCPQHKSGSTVYVLCMSDCMGNFRKVRQKQDGW